MEIRRIKIASNPTKILISIFKNKGIDQYCHYYLDDCREVIVNKYCDVGIWKIKKK